MVVWEKVEKTMKNNGNERWSSFPLLKGIKRKEKLEEEEEWGFRREWRGKQKKKNDRSVKGKKEEVWGKFKIRTG